MLPSDSDAERDVVQVVLGHGPQIPLDYLCPAGGVAEGTLVRVPFRHTAQVGLVVSRRPAEVAAGRLRAITEVLGPALGDAGEAIFVADAMRLRYLSSWPQAVAPILPGARGFEPEAARWEIAAALSPEERDHLRRRAPRQLAAFQSLAEGPRPLALDLALPMAKKGLVRRHVPIPPRPPQGGGPELTSAQAAALEALRRGRGGTHLLFGVTGSGKTEVYFRLIEDALAAGRGALLLVPEIALTAQLVDLVQARFGNRAAVLHSAVGETARHSALRRLHEGLADVVVGPRSAVFAPIEAGVVIVDEQHEASYQQEEAPRYHAQDVALWRAARRGATLVLGSATPDLATFQAASEGRIGLVELPERIAGRPLPEVRLVDLRRNPGRIFTPELTRAVADSLRQGQQAILLLNRRGYHPSMICTACGHVPTCPQCSVAVAYHEGGEAVCHLCGWRGAAPGRCPACQGRLRLLGTGTQRVAQAAQETWPGARVLRLDRDAVQRVGGADKVYAAFRRGAADILVGTQMVAKGFDFPLVTTVGVVIADIGLGQPDYRASERTFQLLMQVTGRAGRAEHPGRAVIQAFDPEHAAFRHAARHDYRGFAAQELGERRRGGYPPFGELLLIGYSGIEEQAVEGLARRRTMDVRQMAGPDVRVLGPAPAPIPKVKGRYRWQTLLIAQRRELLRQIAAALPPVQDAGGLREALFFDPRQFR